MSDRKKPETTSEFLDSLNEFLMDRPEETIEELQERLKSHGVNPERVVKRVQNLVEKKLREYRLAWQEQARREREEAAEKISKTDKYIDWTKKQLLEKIHALLKDPNLKTAQAHFRNLTNMTEKGLKSILEDLEHTKSLSEKTEKNDGEVN